MRITIKQVFERRCPPIAQKLIEHLHLMPNSDVVDLSELLKSGFTRGGIHVWLRAGWLDDYTTTAIINSRIVRIYGNKESIDEIKRRSGS